MIIHGPTGRFGSGKHTAWLDGPQWIWKCGPVTIEYHNYGGPMFWLFGHAFMPRRYSPWWILWTQVRRRMQGEH